MYGIHSIAYRNLDSYFYVFAVREKDQWLSWEEVKFYAALLDFPTVPEIPIQHSLASIANQYKDENRALAAWFKANLSMPWEARVAEAGLLGGYDPRTKQACSEGFVVRNAAGFQTNNDTLPVATNEFDQLFKVVRAAHVQTDIHWTKNWQAAKLVDYEKHLWHAYQYQY